MHKWLLVAMILIVGVTGAGQAAAPVAVAQPADPIRIVVQNQGVDQDDPDLAAWSPDESLILTMWSQGNDQVLLRNPDNGQVIDRLTLPPPPDDDEITVNTLQFGASIDTATATAFATGDGPHPRCRWGTYAINLVTMSVAQSWQDKGSYDCDPAKLSVAKINGVLASAAKSGHRIVFSATGAAKGLFVTDATGKPLVSLDKPKGSLPTLGLRHAALAPDGRTMALIVDRNGGVEPIAPRDSELTQAEGLALPFQHTTIALFDMALQRFGKGLTIDGSYTRAQWIDAGKFLVMRAYTAGERDVAASMHEDRSLFAPPPARVFDAATGTITASIAMRCYLTPLQHGEFIGADMANCLGAQGRTRGGLQRYEPGKGWLDFAPGSTGPGGLIDAIAVSPDGRSVAVIARTPVRAANTIAIILIDARTGHKIASQPLPPSLLANDVQFEANGRSLLIQAEDKHFVWIPSSHLPPTVLWTDPWFNATAGLTETDGGTVVHGLPGNDTLVRISRVNGTRLPDLHLDKVMAWGFVPGKPQFWAASADNGVRFWDTRNWAPMQTVVLFGRHHSLGYTPDGRYDTDLSPDTATFRWLVADEPFRSLGPQTFMRTYYTPRLLERLERCIAVSGGCAAAFPKMRPPIALNRALPGVTIDAVRQGSKPDTAEIDVTVANGSDDQDANRATTSGLYDLRLFRNGSLVAEYPSNRTETVDETITDWRTANALPAGPDGKAHHRFVVALPTGPGNAKVRFSAYAFNSDRIKSDTAVQTYDSTHAPMRARRTFVLAIGINAYAEPRLKLHYAADDATLMTERLGHLPWQAVHTLTLTDAKATKARILAALDLLAGGNRKADLAKLGLRDSGFVRSTPDDDVIVTFSGHGWADAHGNFYLLPTDAQWHDTVEFPLISSLLSSAEIADALKQVDAGDMALVIDACHSAASVDTVWFKPGPMGDPGLGQLAFDKGIRILAAAGRDSVAREDRALHHGLLTAALVRDGIDETGFGKADLDRDHRIMLDEWLRYAVTRLPELSEEESRKPASSHRAGPFTVLNDSQALPPPPQVPALFDFTRHASTEILREERHP